MRHLGFLSLFIIIVLAACTTSSPPTPFIPPTSQSSLIEPVFIITPTLLSNQVQIIPLPTIIATIDQTNCTNDLEYVQDLTIPDNSFISFGTIISKEWLVENTGTCNWTSAYSLYHIDGALLDAPEIVALYPAKAGTQAVIHIEFVAPFLEAVYESVWQAFDPDGLPFGEPIYMSIIATP